MATAPPSECQSRFARVGAELIEGGQGVAALSGPDADRVLRVRLGQGPAVGGHDLEGETVQAQRAPTVAGVGQPHQHAVAAVTDELRVGVVERVLEDTPPGGTRPTSTATVVAVPSLSASAPDGDAPALDPRAHPPSYARRSSARSSFPIPNSAAKVRSRATTSGPVRSGRSPSGTTCHETPKRSITQA